MGGGGGGLATLVCGRVYPLYRVRDSILLEHILTKERYENYVDSREEALCLCLCVYIYRHREAILQM